MQNITIVIIMLEIGPANRYLIESGWQASAGLERLTVDDFEGRSGSGGVGLNVQAGKEGLRHPMLTVKGRTPMSEEP